MYYKCAVLYIAVVATTMAATTANELFDAFVEHVNREKKIPCAYNFTLKFVLCR